jgi:hypothetical protein
MLASCDPVPEDCAKSDLQKESDSSEVKVAGCSPDQGGGGDDVVIIPPVQGDPVGGDLPSGVNVFSANVSFTNFTAADIDKVEAALIFIQRIVRTQEFRQRVLNHRYDGQVQFSNNNGFTNAQIYQMLVDGAETLKPLIDNKMDLELELYTNNYTSTVGYTYPNTLRIWMNRKFFNRYSAEEVARNVFHEWTHKLGFGHDSKATARRPYSVPYALGSIIQDMAFKM